MTTATQAEIHVPAMMDGDRVIVPSVALGRGMEYRTDGRNNLTAAAYQAFGPPTLAELRHAYFDKDQDGNYVAPEYRESVLSNRGRGEWTSTFLRDGREAVVQPERVFYDDGCGMWIAEGGSIEQVELPNNGWATEYDRPTGFPSRTGSKKDAHREFGNDASYFYATRSGLRAVLRLHGLDVDGPFYVDAVYEPGSRVSDLGARSRRRLEQGAERLATPVYVLDRKGYEILERLAAENPEASEILSRVRQQE